MNPTERKNEPLKFADAESCLRLTLATMNPKPADSEFLEKAMRTYAELRIAEARPQ
jgi:hypothetical protein